MLLPISHEKMTVRRLPVVTIAIIVATLLCHAATSSGTAAREERAMQAMLAARLLYLQHPSLGLCKPLEPFVSRVPIPDVGAPDAADKTDGDKRDVVERYEAACEELAETFGGLPDHRFGYVPARANVLGLLTYMFLHADWWHVIGNMWFLFLCGLALEDRWGRLAFAAYYVVGGVVAAGVHHLLTANGSAALIGASGAVAAAMGAFLVLFATTKIRFVGFFAFRIFSFAAPAYVMLPMWAAVEVLYGLLASSWGTAHWAHVGGFAFGAAVAAGFRVFGVDRKLDDAVERTAVLGDDPRVDAARAMVAKGEAAHAVALLEGLAKEKPESIHVWEALRDAARANGDTTLADHAAGMMATIDAARSSGRPSGSGSISPMRASSPVAPVRTSTPAPVSPRASRPSVKIPSAAMPAASASVAPAQTAAPFFPPPTKKG
jgi:membrane associated rhomboid family serine protease